MQLTWVILAARSIKLSLNVSLHVAIYGNIRHVWFSFSHKFVWCEWNFQQSGRFLATLYGTHLKIFHPTTDHWVSSIYISRPWNTLYIVKFSFFWITTNFAPTNTASTVAILARHSFLNLGWAKLLDPRLTNEAKLCARYVNYTPKYLQVIRNWTVGRSWNEAICIPSLPTHI